ncbi:hypothetical protein STEG23_015020, partial [Scotinomys teguina]
MGSLVPKQFQTPVMGVLPTSLRVSSLQTCPRDNQFGGLFSLSLGKVVDGIAAI